VAADHDELVEFSQHPDRSVHDQGIVFGDDNYEALVFRRFRNRSSNAVFAEILYLRRGFATT
jgi:hypothetical protein